ncbi:Porin O precursor [Caulifigura coniformis]|uniref:Porin O n=1 Tax=Caulifigura coniformis TaxID=2527983 RepID=A0A517SLW1_9PLAN|nr:porin [Caulifigura coniformis]QDT57116.1 Porin O precursor [Caulifigura coniformis]
MVLLIATVRADAQQDTTAASGPTIHLRGRIDADFLWADQDADNGTDFGHFADTVGLRRARVGAYGDLSENGRYLIEIDLASGDVVLRDGYIALGDVKNAGEFQAGHFREPFSLEGGTSANSFAFLERSPANVLDPARNWGAVYRINGAEQRWTIAGGAFQSGTDSSDVEFGPGSTTDMTVRATALPIADEDDTRLLHLGVAATVRIANDSLIVINQRPRSPLLSFGDSTDSPFVPTLSFAAASSEVLNLQWAGVYGSLWSQAEWYGALINQDVGDDVFLHGSHFDVGYFLTGEHRGYHRDTGVFGAVTVLHPVIADFSSSEEKRDRGIGAWEATFRVATLDFDSSNLPAAATGVKLHQYTMGVNWYLADRMRLMLDYTLAFPDLDATGSSRASVFGMRLGMFW